MATIPKVVRDLIEAFERLPGIGPKTAQRLTYHLLHAPKEESQALASSVLGLKEKTVICQVCFNISDKSPCDIDTDPLRDKSIIAVVEDPLDVLALEKANYNGLYHVLHGSISPLENIGPEELRIRELLPRLKEPSAGPSATSSGQSGSGQVAVKEIILATNPTMEGEATAMYIDRLIRPLGIKVTRIARGLPVGGDLEYADATTLSRALDGRKEY